MARHNCHNFGARVAGLLGALVVGAAPASAGKCEELLKLEIPGVTITTASSVAPGAFTPGDSAATLQVPAFCRVIAVVKPTSDSVIGFEVWIPPAEQWNRRFEGVGNGAYNGAIHYAEMAEALKRGFATAGTDTGHRGADLTFAEGHPEKIIDWAYRSIHVMTDSAKLIIRNYAGAFPSHSYFGGCSTGGAQALSEVQRYPADYDGVIAGDPGNSRVHLNVGYLWAFTATHDASGNAILPTSKLPLINRAAVAACDEIDGLKDGIISDPQACHFDPGQLLCKGAEDDHCLTPAQIVAVKKVYAGPMNPRTGEQIIAGYSIGSESPEGDQWAHGWDRFITSLKEPMRLEFWKYWVFNDPGWDWRTFDYDRDVAYADEKLKAVNATETDLSAFRDRGGKVLMYSGWADPIGPPMDAVNYYERVKVAMGGRQQTESFFRLFMVPGMAHCVYGPGPNIFGGFGTIGTPTISTDAQHDILIALTEWVEKGSAPEKIIAGHITGGELDRTRPICPYPKVARWIGEGNSDDAKNFTCVDQDQRRKQSKSMAKH
ncbi:MAG: tannase/feruloyl esterase family alpha/beta hydrolase [Acidobacteriaceae bacterium]|nr:tannase/feruloyl esterase family alpha/beta hydrolase [Acidobacteriaceae bacterium]